MSENIMCKEYNLDWEQKPLKILGVTFTAEVFNIWDHNLEVEGAETYMIR